MYKRQYQLYYVFVVLTRKPKKLVAKKNHRFAAVISARNESAVIGDLIHSIKAVSYTHLDVYKRQRPCLPAPS